MHQFHRVPGRKEEPISREEFERMGKRWEELTELYKEKTRPVVHDPTRQLSPAEKAEIRAIREEIKILEAKLLQMEE